MKNIFLVFFSICIALCVSEATLRVVARHANFTGVTLNYPPLFFSKRGYWLNPDHGQYQPFCWRSDVQYYYYPFHLTNTPINQAATHILVLGDSFTFGWELPWKDTYLYHIQNKIDQTFGKNKFQLLNAAVEGWGTSDQLAYLEEHGAETSPKYVLIFLNTDDIGRSMKQSIYKYSATNPPHLIENFHPLHRYLIDEIYDSWLFKNSTLLHLLYTLHVMHAEKKQKIPTYFHEFPSSYGLKYQDKFAVQYGEALFLQINQWCKQHHAKLLVVTTGFNVFYPKDLREPTKIFLAAAPAFFQKEHIPFYDGAQPLKKMVAGKIFLIPRDDHPNAFGASVIATVNWLWIRQELGRQHYM